MVRRVFFSFDYDRDISRVNTIRHSNITKDVAGFVDYTGWESLKRQGDYAIERWINQHLEGTSVTIVLIGAQTSNSRWVQYEIQQSKNRGNGIFGIQIHMIENLAGQIDYPGDTSFLYGYNIYHWKNDGGYLNIDRWIEKAATEAGRY